MQRFPNLVVVLVMAGGLKSSLAFATPTSEKNVEELCVGLAQAGRSIMDGRQSGVSMIKLMGVANNAGELAPLMKNLVQDAFKSPRYETQEMKTRVIQDFEDKVYATCLQLRKR
jgi:hypothetical protein